MSEHYPVLIILAPLLAAFLNSGLLWLNRRMCYPITALGIGASLYFCIGLLLQVLTTGPVTYHLGGWAPPMGIELRIDHLSALVLLLIPPVALVNILASRKNVHEELTFKSGAFYTVYLLFVAGLLGIVATADLFNLYVLLEITSLAAYALLAMGDPDRAPLASLNYVFLGVIGASFYLLGVGYLYIMTGSLNMGDVHSLLPPILESPAIMAAFVFCLVGVWIKMGLFPLHTWMPNAYAYAPVSSNRLIAPLMTKVMVYVMIRIMISVFGLDYIFGQLALQKWVLILASAAIIAGAVMALAQRDLLKMAAYIIVCEIGYMVGGVWLGNNAGMTGSILHIVNDVVMTFALFLAIGNIIYIRKKADFEHLRGLFTTMPWTMAGLFLTGASIIGVPPTCGFFSKWYLLLGGIEAGSWHFVSALILSSLVWAILFFRIVEIAFFSEENHSSHGGPDPAPALNEAPVSMLIPLGLAGTAVIALGIWSGYIVQYVILPFTQQGIS
ncbi:MAG: complex I subunit 5 family protein [Desulfonatronovibrionaceae bacterium]